jgi:hypothetical protein
MAYGNDPVNYADPSGLSMQGHPLGGGYSGNVTRKPTISSGRIPATSVVNPFATTTFGGFVDAERGRQILGLPPAPKAVAPLPTPVQQFNRSLSQSSNLSTLTRTVDPLQSFVSQTHETRAYWHQVELDRNAVVRSETLGNGWAGQDFTAQAEKFDARASRSNTSGGAFGNQFAAQMNRVSAFTLNTVAGHGTPARRVTYGDGRTVLVIGGPDTASLANQATFFGPMVLAGASRGATAPQTAVRTNAQLVDDVGTRAGEWAQRTRQQTTLANASPRTVGIKQHTYAKNVLDRYQRMFGNRNLVTEQSFIKGNSVRYGAQGSTRIDVLDTITGAAWDYKFGTTPMRQSQIQKIFQNGPGVTSVTPIYKP